MCRSANCSPWVLDMSLLFSGERAPEPEPEPAPLPPPEPEPEPVPQPGPGPPNKGCDANPCQNDGTCVVVEQSAATPDGYVCKCYSGYSGDRCEHDDDAVSTWVWVLSVLLLCACCALAAQSGGCARIDQTLRRHIAGNEKRDAETSRSLLGEPLGSNGVGGGEIQALSSGGFTVR